MTEPLPILTVDIGGTKTAAAVVLPDGQVTGRLVTATPAPSGSTAVLSTALTLAAAGLTAAGLAFDGIAAVGIGSAGVIDPRSGVVLSATDALPGWAGTAIADAFASWFHRPAYALNDVHAHGLGEARVGAGRGKRTVLLVTCGTGIGGAFVLDGRVQTGAHHVAGHIGHLSVPEAAGLTCSCGREGHVEALSSGPGTLAAYQRSLAAGGLEPETIPSSSAEVAELARTGEPDSVMALRVLHQCGYALGRVVGGLLNVLYPDVVILGGGVAGSGPPWWDAVGDGVQHDAMNGVRATPVVPARAGADAALVGAAAHARDWLNGDAT